MYDEKINFSIEPIFKPSETVYNEFVRIEAQCDIDRGLKVDDFVKNAIRSDHRKEWKEENNHFAFAAYHNEQMLGFVTGFMQSKNMYLSHLYIDPMYQDFGIGSELLKTAENSASIITRHIELFPEYNAVDFYEKHEYKNFKNVVMVKQLSESIRGVVPVFQWHENLQAKLNFKIETSEWNKQYKYQPIFVYVNKEYKIDGVGIRLPNGEAMVKLNDRIDSQILKYRKLDLLYELDKFR